MAPIELKRERSAEGQPNQVDPPQAEGVYETGKTVGIVQQPERLRRI
jgi:hypothetical protein